MLHTVMSIRAQKNPSIQVSHDFYPAHLWVHLLSLLCFVFHANTKVFWFYINGNSYLSYIVPSAKNYCPSH